MGVRTAHSFRSIHVLILLLLPIHPILRLYWLSHLCCKCLLGAACSSPTSMIPPSNPNCSLNTSNSTAFSSEANWCALQCEGKAPAKLDCVCTGRCAPETGGRWTCWSRIGWKEGKESADGRRRGTRSTNYVAPDGKEISVIWGCWSRIRETNISR